MIPPHLLCGCAAVGPLPPRGLEHLEVCKGWRGTLIFTDLGQHIKSGAHVEECNEQHLQCREVALPVPSC